MPLRPFGTGGPGLAPILLKKRVCIHRIHHFPPFGATSSPCPNKNNTKCTPLSLADNFNFAISNTSNLCRLSRHVYTGYINMSINHADSALENSRETRKHLALAMGSTTALPID